ncbi:MAG: hypothetical protein IJ560_00285, partial [Alphaproteobacteria bacterium]|nr:hypothetical protein [Alphaproteobacteria bacterium]
PFFWCTNCFYKTPEIRHFIFLYPCTKKRWFFGAWGVVCGIGAANAELPENVTFCIPKYYTITYKCGCGDNAPNPVTVSFGENFTTPDAASVCGGAWRSWRVDGTTNYITSNTTLPYTYPYDITLIAGGDFSVNPAADRNIAEMTWSLRWSWGTFSGIARCSVENNVAAGQKYNGPNAEPTDDRDKEHFLPGCWCHLITDLRENTAWIKAYGGSYRTMASCLLNCPGACSRHSYYNTANQRIALMCETPD